MTAHSSWRRARGVTGAGRGSGCAVQGLSSAGLREQTWRLCCPKPELRRSPGAEKQAHLRHSFERESSEDGVDSFTSTSARWCSFTGNRATRVEPMVELHGGDGSAPAWGAACGAPGSRARRGGRHPSGRCPARRVPSRAAPSSSPLAAPPRPPPRPQSGSVSLCAPLPVAPCPALARVQLPGSWKPAPWQASRW